MEILKNKTSMIKNKPVIYLLLILGFICASVIALNRPIKTASAATMESFDLLEFVYDEYFEINNRGVFVVPSGVTSITVYIEGDEIEGLIISSKPSVNSTVWTTIYNVSKYPGHFNFTDSFTHSVSAGMVIQVTGIQCWNYINAILEYEARETVPLPADPEKEGHTFVGWYYDAAFKRPYDGKPIYEDTDLFAKFDINSYTIYFDSNGGSNVPSVSRDWNTTYSSLPKPTRNGYDFLGWYNGATKVTSVLVKDNVYLTAEWEIINYSITFSNLQDGTHSNPATFTVEDKTIVLSNPVRNGYNGSWNILTIQAGSTGNKTVSAVWSPIVYTITYENLDGGAHNNPATYTIETNTISFNAPTKDGATGSWDIQTITKGSTGNKVITAVWQVSTFTVTFKINDDIYTVLNVPYGSVLVECIEDFATSLSMGFELVGIGENELVRGNTTLLGAVFSDGNKIIFSKIATAPNTDPDPDTDPDLDFDFKAFWEEYKIFIVIGGIILLIGIAALIKKVVR